MFFSDSVLKRTARKVNYNKDSVSLVKVFFDTEQLHKICKWNKLFI